MFAIIGAILAIGLLIVVHEAGHYYAARKCGMRVERFSIGFGPPILKWRRGETDFTLGPIPFGGFVQIHGMLLADEVEPDDERSYSNRPAWQRFITIFAGPGTNYLFAIVLAIILFASAGMPSGTSWFLVDSFTEQDGIAFEAEDKLKRNDRIMSINGDPVFFSFGGQTHTKLGELVNNSKGEPLSITVMRNDELVEVQVAPQLTKNSDDEPVYRLGIGLAYHEERVSVGIGTTISEALYYPIEKTKIISMGLYEIATGQQKAMFLGPVGITDVIKKSIDVGWIRVLELLMLLNVYLGLFNLLPLPALDGGRLVFLGYEMATRRRANPRVEATVHMVGIMALLLLMVLVTYQDIARLF